MALDAEVGVNFQLSDMVSLNLGIGGILTTPIAQLEEAYHPSILENVSPQRYQFTDSYFHAPSLKLGLSFVLFSDPNRESSNCCCEDDTSSSSLFDSSSCN